MQDIFRKFPQKSRAIADELSHAGIECTSCCSASAESLDTLLMSEGLTDPQINDLISRLNEILDEPSLTTISLTVRAAKQFQEILAENNKTGYGLRLGIEGASCCGFEYFLDTSKSAEESDRVFESHGVQIHVDCVSLPHLMGTVIDFVEGNQGPGFKIINPSAGCGCGCHE